MEFELPGPFYFMRYYIVLSILAPIVYVVLHALEKIKKRGKGTPKYKVAFLIILWFIGYYLRNRLHALGASYLAIYALGIMIGMEYDKVVEYLSKRRMIVFLGWLLSVMFSCNTFWFVIDSTNRQIVGLDRFIEYTINPPNLGVTFYAIMTTALAIMIYRKCNKMWLLGKIIRFICVLGKYSLDIYLWHILCQHLCVRFYLASGISIWPLRIIAYTAMFGLPILGRRLYIAIKNRGTNVLQNISTDIF